MQPTIITLRMLCEIAAEVHDPLLKSARKWTAERNSRDGQIRDSLRIRGEVKIILDGLVKLVEQGIRSNGGTGLQEVIDWSLNTLATWARELGKIARFKGLIRKDADRYPSSSLG
jgi:exportin-T